MLQGGEIIIILLIALVVLGPQRLPDLARKIGKWSTELRAAARDVRRGLEAEVADLKQVGEDLKAPIEDLKNPMGELVQDMNEAGISRLEWSGPKPVSGPTPEDAMADLERIEAQGHEDEGQRDRIGDEDENGEIAEDDEAEA